MTLLQISSLRDVLTSFPSDFIRRPPHLGHNSVHDEGFDGGDVALWVVDGDEQVFGVDIPLLLVLLQSILVDHGAGGGGHGTFVSQGCVLNR